MKIITNLKQELKKKEQEVNGQLSQRSMKRELTDMENRRPLKQGTTVRARFSDASGS